MILKIYTLIHVARVWVVGNLSGFVVLPGSSPETLDGWTRCF